MEPINFAGALWRSWRLLLVLGLVGAVVAVLMPIPHLKQQKPVLHFTADAVVGTVPKGGSNLLGGGVTGQQIQFYASSLTVEQDAVKVLHFDVPADQLGRYMVATIGLPSTKGTSAAGSPTTTAAGKASKATNEYTVTLNAYGTTKKNAYDLANSWAIVLGDVLTNVANNRAAAAAAAKASAAAGKKTTDTTTPAPAPAVSTGYQIIAPAGPATTRKAPLPSLSKLDSRKIRLPLGFALGALLGAVIVIVRMLLDKRIRTAARAAAAFGFPVLVEIPERPPVSADQRAVPVDVAGQPHSPEAEAFRMLRMSVLFEALATSHANDPLASLFGNGHGSFGAFGASVPAVPTLHSSERSDRHVVLVLSPAEETTRPVVAANLASVCAEAAQQVIVVGTGELRTGRPLGPMDGVLTGEIRPVDVEARLEPTRVPHVSRLPLSLFLQNSSQLVTRGKELLDTARSISDVVIVEAPGLLSVHHAEALSHAVDVVLVVGECGATRIADAKRAGDLLRRLGAPVLGVVLTNVRPAGVRRARRGPVVHAPGPIPASAAPAQTPVTAELAAGAGAPSPEESAAPTQV